MKTLISPKTFPAVCSGLKTMMSLFSEDTLPVLQLLPNLYHLGGASWAGANGSLSNPIQETLESMAGEVTRVVDEQLKVCG